MKTYLITTSTCPKCGPAKKWLEDHNKPYTLIIADTDPVGYEFATNLGISFVPAIVIENDVGKFEVLTINEYKNV